MSLATEHFSTTVPDQPHIIGTMKRRTQAIQMKKDLPLGEKRDWVLLSLDYELEQLKKQGSPSTKRLRELRQLRQRVQDF